MVMADPLRDPRSLNSNSFIIVINTQLWVLAIRFFAFIRPLLALSFSSTTVEVDDATLAIRGLCWTCGRLIAIVHVAVGKSSDIRVNL